jgi:hypothetical protein
VISSDFHQKLIKRGPEVRGKWGIADLVEHSSQAIADLCSRLFRLFYKKFLGISCISSLMIIYEDLGVQMFSPEKDVLFFLYTKHSDFSYPNWELDPLGMSIRTLGS